MKGLLAALPATLLVSIVSATEAPEVASTCFNDENEDEIAVWVFEGQDSWRRARERPEETTLLLFVLPKRLGRFSIDDSRFCARVEGADGRSFQNCVFGSFEISGFEAAQRLSGRYRLVLEDGSVKDRDFEAENCRQTTQEGG